MKRKKSSSSLSKTRSSSKPTSKQKIKVISHLKPMHCLLCFKLAKRVSGLRDVNNKLIEDEGLKEMNERVKICSRFYNHVKTGSRSTNGVVTDEGSEEYKKWQLIINNYGVCDDCFLVVETHCSIYQELEVLKLRLRGELDKTHKIMKYAGKVPSRVMEFKESFNSLNEFKSDLERNDGESAAHQLQEKLTEIMRIRQCIYNACAKRLKMTKSPTVLLSRWKNPLEEGTDNNSFGEEDSTKRSRNNVQKANSERQDLPSSETNNSFNHNNACDDNSDHEDFMYIFKSKGEKIVTPPESLLETIRTTGDIPMEGTASSSATSKRSKERGGNDVIKVAEKLTDEPSVQYVNELEKTEEEGSNLPQNSKPLYQCIKCSKTFPSKDTLILHARKGKCFTDENIDLNAHPPPTDDQVSSIKTKRLRSSTASLTEHNSNNKRRRLTSKVNEENEVKGKSEKVNSETIPPSPASGNILSNVVDKVLLGLRSVFKCPNCSETFPSDATFKSHVVARECFKTMKKRSKSSISSNNQSSLSKDDNSDSDSSNVSSASSLEENSDLDYAPNRQRNGRKSTKTRKRRKKNRETKTAEKELIKKNCPEDNCSKFFLHKEDLERHLKEHSTSQMSCQFCSFTTDLASRIVHHEVRKHSKKDVNGNKICPRCPSTKILSSDKHRQTDHYMRMHLSSFITAKKEEQDTSAFLLDKCGICGAVVRAKTCALVEASMKRHIKTEHKGSKKRN